MKKIFSVLLALSSTAQSSDFNRVILDSMMELYQGGGYSTRPAAAALLNSSITVTRKGELKVKMTSEGPTYCSGATYLAFLTAMLNNKTNFRSSEARKLRTVDSGGEWLDDGHGFWGRWNANGPGTAMAVHDLDLGINFRDDGFYAAKAGDFLKIFWTVAVGKYERGHSVVFTRVIPAKATGDDVEEVCYWSSQGPRGIGEVCTNRELMINMIFSRITKPDNLKNVTRLPRINEYLASLLTTESSFEEAVEKTGTLEKYPD